MSMKIGMIVLIALIIGLVGFASAEPAMYFTETDVMATSGQNIILELRLENDVSASGIQGEIWYDDDIVTILGVDFATSEFQPLAGPGYSYQEGHVKFATVNMSGISAGDYLVGYIEIEVVADESFDTNISLQNMVPSHLSGRGVRVRSDDPEPTPTPTEEPTEEPTVEPDDAVVFTVQVYATQEVSFTVNAAEFGYMQVGEEKKIDDSISFINNNPLQMDMFGRFVSNVSGIYGFVAGENVIQGDNFGINAVPMLPSGQAQKFIILDPMTTMNCSTSLVIPDGTANGDYEGRVKLTYGEYTTTA